MAQFDDSYGLSETNKLTEASNYTLWKFDVKQLLKKEDLWKLVEAPIPSNATLVSTVGPTIGDPTVGQVTWACTNRMNMRM